MDAGFLHSIRLFLSILISFLCIGADVCAQTPYDSFSPETSRPILDVIENSEKELLQRNQIDTIIITICHVNKWLSVDPLSDKFPDISPYAYCGANPIKYIDADGREKHIFLSTTDSYAAQNFHDDNGIYIFAHGNSNKVEDHRSTEQNDYNAAKLAEHILDRSAQYENDAQEGNASMVFLYACNTGEGENSLAQQLSSILNEHETFVIAPMGILESTNSPLHPQDGRYSGVKDTKTKGEGAWGVYKNGDLLTKIRGNRKPTRSTVKFKMFIDEIIPNITN